MQFKNRVSERWVWDDASGLVWTSNLLDTRGWRLSLESEVQMRAKLISHHPGAFEESISSGYYPASINGSSNAPSGRPEQMFGLLRN